MVPNLQVKDTILKAMRLRWGVAGLWIGVQTALIPSGNGLHHPIPFPLSLLFVALTVLILKGAPRKIVRTLARYNADGRN